MDSIKILGDLISINTSLPSGENYKKIINYLEPLFRESGCKTARILIPREYASGQKNRFNLLAHRRNPGKPRLIFYAHIDTVPAEGWDAFRPRLRAGKIFGRGAADMKGAIPALLSALQATKEESVDYDISAMITTDEETDQKDQIEYLSSFLQPREGAYLFDLDTEFGYVCIAGLAALQFEIKIKGKSVHSADAHLGVNAIEKAIPLLNALKELQEKVVARKSKIEASPATGLGHLEGKLNINEIKGGLEVNIVPDECLITIDRRVIPEENLDEAENEIINTLNTVHDTDWSIKRTLKSPTFVTKDPITDKLAKIIQGVTGQTGKYGTMGSGDLIETSNKWQMKHFGVGVIRPNCNVHGENEFVYLKDIDNLAEIIEKFLTS